MITNKAEEQIPFKFDDNGITEIHESELFLTWATDELMQRAFPNYSEYVERMKKVGVAVYEYIDK